MRGVLRYKSPDNGGGAVFIDTDLRHIEEQEPLIFPEEDTLSLYDSGRYITCPSCDNEVEAQDGAFFCIRCGFGFNKMSIFLH